MVKGEGEKRKKTKTSGGEARGGGEAARQRRRQLRKLRKGTGQTGNKGGGDKTRANKAGREDEEEKQRKKKKKKKREREKPARLAAARGGGGGGEGGGERAKKVGEQSRQGSSKERGTGPHSCARTLSPRFPILLDQGSQGRTIFLFRPSRRKIAIKASAKKFPHPQLSLFLPAAVNSAVFFFRSKVRNSFFLQVFSRRAPPSCDSLLLSFCPEHYHEHATGFCGACELVSSATRPDWRREKSRLQSHRRLLFAAVCTDWPRLAGALSPSSGRSLAATTRQRDS